MDVHAARAWVAAIAEVVVAQKERLTELDAAIGDGDHGQNLARGFTAVTDALDAKDPTTPGEVLTLVGATLISTVGGASGPLYGTAFRRAGKALGEGEVSPKAFGEALHAALDGIGALGKAAEGDKTMVDAWAPAVRAYDEAVAGGADLAAATAAAAEAAEAGAEATAPMEARKGRASYLGPRSVGHQDPGATSTALILRALATTAAGP